LTVSGIDRLTHEIGAELDCRVFPEPALILQGPTANIAAPNSNQRC
jgi:hypothetical protein